jgi:glycosyltransferase involved in cell wall biosynthesis
LIAVIVPSHNQGNYIKRIIKGYESQTLVPNILLFVFDRCTDDSENILKTTRTDLNVRYINKLSGSNFNAGMTRDYGLAYIETYFPEADTIIFTDGDCVPNENVVSLHYKNVNQKYPIVSCGYRTTETEEGEWIPDQRFKYADMCNDKKLGRVVLTKKHTIDSILTYSCNFAFNNKAIESCKNINFNISEKNRLFNPEFDGTWGGEDNFISNCIFRSGGLILLATPECNCYHYYHKESITNTNTPIVKKLDRLLVENILDNRLEYDYLEIEPIKNISYPYLQSFNNIHKINKQENIVEEIIKGIPDDIIDMDNKSLKKYLRFILSRVHKITKTSTKNNKVYEYDDTYVYQLTDAINKLKVYYSDDKFQIEQMDTINPYAKVLNFDHILDGNK